MEDKARQKVSNNPTPVNKSKLSNKLEIDDDQAAT